MNSSITNPFSWSSLFSNPAKGFIFLEEKQISKLLWFFSAIYGLETFCFYANWWSLGLKENWGSVLLAAFFVAPLLGLLWVELFSFLLFLSAKFLKIEISFNLLKKGYSASLAPFIITLFIWGFGLLESPERVLIQDGGFYDSLPINLVTLFLKAWSLFLLLNFLKDVTRASYSKLFIQISLSSIVSFTFFFSFASIIRIFVS